MTREINLSVSINKVLLEQSHDIHLCIDYGLLYPTRAVK